MRLRKPPHAENTALLCKVCSILLTYPSATVLGHLPDVRAALPAIGDTRARACLDRFVGWLEGTELAEAAAHYVAVFDHARTRSLYLTYYRHGDTRARGMALLALKHTYREAGFEPPQDELPDFLPVLLEFAALDPDRGQRTLLQCRAGLELLRDELATRDTPYADVLEAVGSPLPALAPKQRAELRRLAAEGPPGEEVGLEPFAPPEYVTGGRL